VLDEAAYRRRTAAGETDDVWGTYEIRARGGDSNSRQFRELFSVSEVLDISTAGSGLAESRRAWTAAAASETRGRSVTGKGGDPEATSPIIAHSWCAPP